MLRRATPADLPALHEIINYYIENTTYSYAEEPQTMEETRRWFSAVNTRRYDIFVAEESGVVVGYGCYTAFRNKAAYEVSVEHSIYLLPGWEGRGHGRALMEALIRSAREKGYWNMIAVIDGSNQNSVTFHEHMGFTHAGTLSHIARKFGRALDVVYLQYRLNPPHMDALSFYRGGEESHDPPSVV